MRHSYSVLTIAALLVGLSMTACGPGSSQDKLRWLADNYRTAEPQEVLSAIGGLDENDRGTIMVTFPAVGIDMLLKACQANPNLQWKDGWTMKNCAITAAERNHVVSMGYGKQVASNIEDQRQRLLIMMKCGSGEIDRGSCRTYMGVSAGMANESNNTSTVINANIGGRCIVGIDDGCQL